MRISEARHLIQTPFIRWDNTHVWADLGCGSGVFTHALAGLLSSGSTIHAVDQAFQDLHSLRSDVVITFQQANFITDQLMLPTLDGLMMANSLHYVSDKPAFFDEVSKYLRKESRIIIVEYDTDQASSWVPFPVSYKKLQSLVREIIPGQIQKTGTRNSIYGPREIYACVISFDK